MFNFFYINFIFFEDNILFIAISKHTLYLPPDLQVVEFRPPRVYDVIKSLYMATVAGDQGLQYTSRVYIPYFYTW